MKTKRFLSAMLVSALILTHLTISTVYAADSVDQSVTYNFDGSATVPDVFSRMGGGGAISIDNNALKVTTNAGATEILKINISDWTGAARKKGILTYSFDYMPDIDGVSTQIMVGSNSTATGHTLAALQKTRLLGFNGEKSQAANEWITIAGTSDKHRVTLTFDFTNKNYSCGMGGKEVSHPFDYFADKTNDDDTYTFEAADKFVLYLRTYNKTEYSYYIDNFKAEYTERYVQENIARFVNLVKIIKNNGTTDELKTALLDVATLVGSYGNYNTQIVADDSNTAIAEIKKILYENSSSFDVSESALDTVIPAILDIIKTNMPMISINSANTPTEMAYSISSYSDEYSIDVSYIEGYTEEGKQLFYNNILNYRSKNGKFLSNNDIAAAISEAKFAADCDVAFKKYKTAHALTLPSVFDEYKGVLDVDMSYIEKENRNQTLFILKTMTVNSYLEVPDALKKAYEMAKKNKETFTDTREYEVRKKVGPRVDRTTTVLPNGSYFIDMEGFEWAQGAVDYLYDNGVLSGKGEHIFAPKDKITREEFVKMIVGAFDITLSDENTDLNDIDENQWYAPYVNTAYACGIVEGDNDGSFGVGKYITREEVAAILYRTANVRNVELEIKFGERFDDADQISEYAQNPVGILQYNNIINGVGNGLFEPKLTTTRAEAAVMIYRLLNI